MSELDKNKKEYSAVREALKSKTMDPFSMDSYKRDEDRISKINPTKKGMSLKSWKEDEVDDLGWGK